MTQMWPGYHFCALENGKPVLRDGSALVLGKTYEYKGALVMCRLGYHDSERVVDALRYAPGHYLCRTLASADKCDTDKRVSHYRSAIMGLDAGAILHEFSAKIAYCALVAERLRGREPDVRSWMAVAVKMKWVRGGATDQELSAARNAAGNAACSTAYSAAWGAAESAAESAAWSAAESAAWSAAWSAAKSAACSAEESAAWSAANEMLMSMLPQEFRL